jgi:FtsZ-interacting cell division protein YlmF
MLSKMLNPRRLCFFSAELQFRSFFGCMLSHQDYYRPFLDAFHVDTDLSQEAIDKANARKQQEQQQEQQQQQKQQSPPQKQAGSASSQQQVQQQALQSAGGAAAAADAKGGSSSSKQIPGQVPAAL